MILNDSSHRLQLSTTGPAISRHGAALATAWRWAQVNPYEPEVDWFTREPEIHSLHQGPEPKRRFMPSKWEEKKCASSAHPANSSPLVQADIEFLPIAWHTLLVAGALLALRRISTCLQESASQGLINSWVV